MNRRTAAGLGLLAVYIGSVVAANALTSTYGQITIAPGLKATAGTAVIGGVIMTRDLLQDALGRLAVLAAITAGAALSFALSSHRIALASAITFLAAELAEYTLYTPLRRRVRWGGRRWATVVTAANATGILADTLIFLWLAGYALTWPAVGGQLLGKAYVTAAVITLGMVIRRAVPQPALDTAGT